MSGLVEWNFKPKDDLMYIESISKAKILGITDDNKVILEDFEEGKAGQLWIKGVTNVDGYFILENSKVPKVMTTGISTETLKIQGNIHQRRIVRQPIDDYLPHCMFYI